jgi:prepilin-type processing-associated H-X9-DG protein
MFDCLDGTSNTMIVGEQSDWLLDQNRAKSRKFHGDAGWTVGSTGAGGGWLSGTTRVDSVPKLSTPGGPPVVWGADCWNITTVRYPPNCKWVMGAKPLPGCSENHGINNPLQSPHPGGVLFAFVDGSVQFINERTDLAVLLRLAIRDDGQMVVLD